MKIPFSPPDITEAEVEQVAEALRSGWITTGPKTKELERQVADLCGVNRAVWHGKPVGSIADFSNFSFHAVKNFTTAEGGAATWRDIEGIDNEEIYHQYQLLSLHGQSKDALAKTQLGAWEYDIVGPWYKCNMTDVVAGIGLAQMKRYKGLLERRKEIIGKYDEAFKPLGIEVLNHYTEEHQSSGHVVPVSLTEEIQKSVVDEYNIDFKDTPVVFNGVSMEKCHRKNDYSGNKKILHIGRFSTQKNHEVLVKAFSTIVNRGYDVSLYLYGQGELEESIKEQVNNLHLDKNIFFCGLTDDVYSVMESSDIFVLPSLFEGMPMTLIRFTILLLLESNNYCYQ